MESSTEKIEMDFGHRTTLGDLSWWPKMTRPPATVLYVAGAVLGTVLCCLVLGLFSPATRCDEPPPPPPPPPPRCQLSRTIPNIELLRNGTKDIANANQTILANMAGHIHYHARGFLPFQLARVESREESGVVFVSECTNLTLTTSRIARDARSPSNRYNEPQQHEIEYLTRFEHLYIASDGMELLECAAKLNVQFKSDYRFSCPERSSLRCKQVDSSTSAYYLVADLVLETFELELDGRRSYIARGRFSKPPALDSCEQLE